MLDDVVLQSSVESSRRNVFYTHSSKMSLVHERGETSKNSLSAIPQCVHNISELLNLDTKSKKVGTVVYDY